jgi:hypothetical protein
MDPKRHLFCGVARPPIGGRGHDPDDTLEMLQRLDSHAYRYSTTVQRWQEEVDKDIADREEPTGT